MASNQFTRTPLPNQAVLADAELVRACRAGDMTAWRGLYDRYAPLVHRFSAALGVPVEEREDAAQDIFIAVFRSLRHFRGEAQLSTWIYRIAARHAIRLGRRRRARDLMRLTMLKEKPPIAIDPSEHSTHVALLDRMLAKLPAKKRTVLVLFEIEGLSAKEISEVVGCPENTVWSRLHHARAEMVKAARRMVS
ncbi:MAG: RNA polymerase sigma factor [Deltaproteobacteria bacterium]|jgi:RNA polymerase sigma-70 factor (ECF subfamily)|nr:RNA polymerase sigma factor [Deltaproteobacteria bacterium]